QRRRIAWSTNTTRSRRARRRGPASDESGSSVAAAASHDVLLSAAHLSKSFPGVRALAGVDFELRAGEVHALVGENGAGKSTFVKIITGAHRPDSGTIEVAGRPVEQLDPKLTRQMGIAAIYQQPAMFPEWTVAENIALRQ